MKLVGAVLLALVTGAVCGLPAQAGAVEDRITLSWHVASADPVSLAVDVTNSSDSDLPAWQVTVPFQHLVTDVAGAVSVQDGQTLTLSAHHPLPAGSTDTVRVTIAALGPAPWGPATCSAPALPCVVAPDSDEPRMLPAPSPQSAPTAQLAVDYRVVRDWGFGQVVEFAVTNEAEIAASSWAVAIPAGVHVTNMAGAESTSGGGVIRAQGADAYLPPGQTVVFQATVEPGRSAAWTECRAVVGGVAARCAITPAVSWLRYPELPRW